MAQYFAENHTEMNVSLPLAARYRTLLEVNKAAITQPTPDKVFESMCAALKQLILFDRAGLTLYEPEQDALKLIARQGKFANLFSGGGIARTGRVPRWLGARAWLADNPPRCGSRTPIPRRGAHSG